MKAVVFTWIAWSLSTIVAGQLPPPDAWVRADVATVRLDPSTFTNVPAPVTAELQRRGCTVPQVFGGQQPHNVVRGSFRTPDRVDWAVLCSRQRRSSILIFWNGNPKLVSELATRSDADFLQVISPGEIGFSRGIAVASPDYIRRQAQRYGRPTPPRLTHDGIDDAFVEKASIVWYLDGGKWLQLQGAD